MPYPAAHECSELFAHFAFDSLCFAWDCAWLSLLVFILISHWLGERLMVESVRKYLGNLYAAAYVTRLVLFERGKSGWGWGGTK